MRVVPTAADAGTEGYVVDRIGRGTVKAESLTLSVLGGIQTGKLKAVVDGAIGQGAGADGLLQRLQLLVLPDGLGGWRDPEAPLEPGLEQEAFRVYQRLDNFDAAEVGAFDGAAIPFVRFTEDAQSQVYDPWRRELEERLRTGELAQETPAFSAHLSKYRSLMPGLALLIHLIETVGAGKPFGDGVSLHSAKLAAAMCEYLESHARKLYSDELNPGMTAAHLLAARIKSGAVTDGMNIRGISQKHWSGLKTSQQVQEAAAVLEEANWLRVDEVATGGRPSCLLRLHPDLRKEEQ